MKRFAFFVLIILPLNGYSGTNPNDPGMWTMLFNQTKFHNKLSLHSELQYRSYTVAPNTEQLLIRAGVNFHYDPGITFTAGYGWITNYADDELIFKTQSVDENRIWEQLSLKNNSGRFFLEHRYRVEQRWIESNNKVAYKNRVRYLFRLSIPLTQKEIKKNTLFISFYDELFVQPENLNLDRNRCYGAAGFQFSKTGNIQLGYLVQSIGKKSKGYFQLGLTYNLNLQKQTDQKTAK